MNARQKNPDTGEMEDVSMSATDALQKRQELLANGQAGDARRLSEGLGAAAAKEFIPTQYPGAKLVYEGSGSGTLDLVFRNAPGKEPAFIVVEAKGGSATNSSSRAIETREGPARVQQGHPAYAKDVLAEMKERELLPAREQRALEQALKDQDYDYVEVTQALDGDGGLGPAKAREYDQSLELGGGT